jgi:hypothetical protein
MVHLRNICALHLKCDNNRIAFYTREISPGCQISFSWLFALWVSPGLSRLSLLQGFIYSLLFLRGALRSVLFG